MDLIPKGKNYSFEYGVFPELLRRRESFFAHIPDENYWLDIGTPQRYLQAHHDLLAGKVKDFKAKTNFETIDLPENAEIDMKSLIADNCVINSGVKSSIPCSGAAFALKKTRLLKTRSSWQTLLWKNRLVFLIQSSEKAAQ